MARRIWQEEEDSNDGEGQREIHTEGREVSPQEYDCAPVIRTSSREELIESIKRGEAPTWVPNQALQALLAKENKPPVTQHEETLQGSQLDEVKNTSPGSQPQLPTSHQSSLRVPDEIERPRSALHSGDFHEKYAPEENYQTSAAPSGTLESSLNIPTDPFPPWATPARLPKLSHFHSDTNTPDVQRKEYFTRTRAPSLGSSLSSSFVLRTPTSPLVYSASNAEPDMNVQDQHMQSSAITDKSSRRRTLPLESFRSMQTSLGSTQTPNFSRPLPTPRREPFSPRQTHQPRRSLSSFTYQPLSIPQTPTFLRSRRPSMSSDISPSQHASMVGSFEESIIRGRMSTAPSKPLDFVAQIGVLGKGNCKPSLRCPAHVTVPFPAVFYSYPSTGTTRSFADDSPSPYVGNIDLEHSLKPVELRKHGRRHASRSPSPDRSQLDITAPENTTIGRALARERRQKRRRSQSPKLSLGGCYRVPQEGQLQIIIKNPNKTAVKLYLVPYNLEGMEAGTKTFVRQRSFSAGPVLETPLSDKANPAPIADPLKDKHVLRYLIHLKFCCPAKGRFYLYDNIRVVFANRVPDGKEKLRNEIQLPDPRYSPYKPGRDHSMANASTKVATGTASGRPSFGLGLASNNVDTMDGIIFNGSPTVTAPPPLPLTSGIPFHFTAGSRRSLAKSEPGSKASTIPAQFHDQLGMGRIEQHSPGDQTVSPVPGFLPSTSARGSPIPWTMDSSSSSVRSSPTPVESGGGLLARKLRDLQAQNGVDAFQD
jgi:hypothetical protein